MKMMLKTKGIMGFTLVEILVVLGLFSLIATISLGTLFNAQTINARLQESQATLDNINLSTQTLLRDIRLGTEFNCQLFVPVVRPTVRKNCDSTGPGGFVLFFKSVDSLGANDRVAYYLKKGVLYKNEYVGTSTSILQVTSDDVVITSLKFYVKGAQTSDGSNDDTGATDSEQPLITVSISGHAKQIRRATTSADFIIQTNISPRELDK
jgi:prepilin-type N-terminal cleavage/methylation domain-containing protein